MYKCICVVLHFSRIVDGEQELRNAAEKGDVSEVRRLIKSVSANLTGMVSYLYMCCVCVYSA